MILKDEPACVKVRVIFRWEDGQSQEGELLPQGNGVFSGSIAPRAVGLCFYRFQAEKEDGTFLFIGTTDGIHATVGDWLPEWRQTVYQPDFETPEALAGGIWYQIFPDRFAKGDFCQKRPEKGARIYHENWAERPLFTQDRPDFKGNDFFGGNLAGIREKLPYLKKLGVDLIYLNPIFESGENHRYSTADYESIDPLLGETEDFEALCREAETQGIRIVLDGVFSHTGANSRYFNKEGFYEELGAYQSPDSPFYHWYHFEEFPDRYDCWWGFGALPCVNELAPDFMNYINGEQGIARHWMEKGAFGWRLDVADELPDGFLDAFRTRVKETKNESLIIGEVWENAVEKVSYGARRKFLLGGQCDTVMNYPWLEAVINLVKGGKVADFREAVLDIAESYPQPALRCLMNILSTHDTPRILNRLGADTIPPRAFQADNYLSADQRKKGEELLKKAAFLQFSLPGIPCIFYGDEIAMEGYGDPYCRGTFPWGKEQGEMLEFYRKLGKVRTENRSAFTGGVRFEEAEDQLMMIRSEQLLVRMNLSESPVEVCEEPLLAYGLENEKLLPGGFGWFKI